MSMPPLADGLGSREEAELAPASERSLYHVAVVGSRCVRMDTPQSTVPSGCCGPISMTCLEKLTSEHGHSKDTDFLSRFLP